MKKYCLSLLLSMLIYPVFGQIHIGSNEIPALNKAGKIKSEVYNNFKNSTTIFTLQSKDYQEVQEFEKAIKKVWTVTPFKIVAPQDLGNYTTNGYSIFSFGSLVVQQQGRSTLTTYPHFYYDLWIPEIGQKKIKEKYLARIAIYVDGVGYMEATRNTAKSQRQFSNSMTEFMYNQANIYSWGAGMLEGYLKEVNDALLKKEERGPFTSIRKKDALKSLQTDTLYIPEYCFLKHNNFTGMQREVTIDEADFQNKYPYPFKIVSNAALNKKIISGEAIKYLLFIKNNTDKFINVYDSKTGELLFAEYIKLSSNFKPKDLGMVASAVK